jgi:hypothetical protein
MSTTWNSTLKVSVWKEHECVCCSTVYRYLFERTVKGTGNTKEAAQNSAQQLAVKALTDEVDLQPCPGCGVYQPDMVADRRWRRHGWLFITAMPLFLVFMILMFCDVLSLGQTSLALAATVAVLAIPHVITDLSNPNANLSSNLALAEKRHKSGELWTPGKVQSAPEGAAPIGNGLSGWHVLGYLMMAAGLILLLMPLGLREATGMKVNPGWHPEVIGPGDSSYVWFSTKISSVKGMWNGNPRVTVLNAGELGLARPPIITATAHNSTWGNSISSKSSEKSSSSTLWARIHLPNEAALAGKTLKLRIDMDVSYPGYMGNNTWVEQKVTANHQATLELSSSGAGSLYKQTWWFGVLGGMVLSLAAAGLLAVFSSRFRTQALPTRIFVPEQFGREAEDEPEAPAEDEERRERFRRDEHEDRPPE